MWSRQSQKIEFMKYFAILVLKVLYQIWQIDMGGGSTAVSKEGTLFMRGPLNKKKEIYIWMHPLLDLILYQSAARIKMCRILNAA